MKLNRTTLRRTILILGLILIVASVGLVAALTQPDAAELLTQSLYTLQTITDGHAIVEVQADLPDQSLSGTFEVWARVPVMETADETAENGHMTMVTPPAFRLEVREVSEAEWQGLVAVSDGTQFWLYSPAQNTVLTGTAEEVANLAAEYLSQHADDMPQLTPPTDATTDDAADMPDSPEAAVTKLLAYVTAERTGAEPVGESNAYALRLVPIPEKMPQEVRAAGGLVNVWLRTSDQLPLAVEYTGGVMGAGKVTATLAEINTGLADELFTFAIPEGAEVIQIADLVAEWAAAQVAPADFDALVPTYLPDAARLDGISQVRGAVVQRYNLPDGQSFVVAQGAAIPVDVPAEATHSESVAVRGGEGTLYANDTATRTLLTWTEGEFTFWIGGDLTPDQARQIADSLQ